MSAAATQRRATPGLTAKQDELLALLRAKEAAGERTPSYKEMSVELRVSFRRIQELVCGLAERGYIKRIPGRGRSITLVDKQPTALLADFSDRDLIREIEQRGYRVEVIR